MEYFFFLGGAFCMFSSHCIYDSPGTSKQAVATITTTSMYNVEIFSKEKIREKVAKEVARLVKVRSSEK